jgi:L-rhamnose-H+ transport protein
MMLVPLMAVVFAGCMNGSFAAPMTRMRGWQWQHTWFVWSLLAMFVIPVSVMAATVSNVGAVYRIAGPGAIASTAFYGVLWGAGTVLFGLGISRIGIALSFGIVLGTSSSVGTLVPSLVLRWGRALSHADLLVLIGAAFVLMGVAFSARSGWLRESTRSERSNRSSFAAGLILCLYIRHRIKLHEPGPQ